MTNHENTLREFHHKLERMLNVAPGDVQGHQFLSGLKGWDSLAILEFMMLASTEYKSDMTPEDIAACSTVDELASATLAQSLTPAEVG